MLVVGLDEAGAGPGYGSLWAAAVHLREALDVKDSKKLTARAREALREKIMAAAEYGLGEVTAEEIDSFGMGEARRLVFERALEDFRDRTRRTPEYLVVDGTVFRPWRGVPYECQEGADATVPCVSAASILAKTQRDAQVLAWCDADPTLDERYGIRSNKGYLSARHVQGIREHGRTARHRTSFRIRALGEA